MRRVFQKRGGHAASGLCGDIFARFARPYEHPCRVGPECWNVVASDGRTIGDGAGRDDNVRDHF